MLIFYADSMVMGNYKNLHVFNFTILLKLRKFDAREIYVFYSMQSTNPFQLHVTHLLCVQFHFLACYFWQFYAISSIDSCSDYFHFLLQRFLYSSWINRSRPSTVISVLHLQRLRVHQEIQRQKSTEGGVAYQPILRGSLVKNDLYFQLASLN